MHQIELLLDLKHWNEESLKENKKVLKEKFFIDFDNNNLIDINKFDEYNKISFKYLKNNSIDKCSGVFALTTISDLSYNIVRNYTIDIYEYMNIHNESNILEKNFLKDYLERCIIDNLILYNEFLKKDIKDCENIGIKLAKEKYIQKLKLDKYGLDIREKTEKEDEKNKVFYDSEKEKQNFIETEIKAKVIAKLGINKGRFEKGNPKRRELFIDMDTVNSNKVIDLGSDVYMYLIDNYRICKFHSNNKYSINDNISFIKNMVNIRFTFLDIKFLERIYNNFFIFELSMLMDKEKTRLNSEKEHEEFYDCFLPIIYAPIVDISMINKLFTEYFKLDRSKRNDFKKSLNRVTLYINFYLLPLYYMVFYNLVCNYFGLNIEEFLMKVSKECKEHIKKEHYKKLDEYVKWESSISESDIKIRKQFKAMNRYIDNKFRTEKFQKKELIKSMGRKELRIQKDIIKEKGYKSFIENIMDVLEKE